LAFILFIDKTDINLIFPSPALLNQLIDSFFQLAQGWTTFLKSFSF